MSEEISAKVVCDSIAPHGKRLTTFQIHIPKFLLAEINTHRMLSRNYNSSRAIPAKKMRELATFAPATFGQNKPGMTSATDLSPLKERAAQVVWASARAFASLHHKALESLGVHKQHVNRIIEPYIWCDGVISGTEWKNFFKQRMHIDAQPEMRMLACAMFDAMGESKPKLILAGDYHLPYIVNTDRDEIKKLVQAEDVSNIIKDTSAARCARVSYGFDKPFNIESDINRAAMLKQGEIVHYCYDEKTDVLTENGWKNWSVVSLEDKIAAVDIATKSVSFEKPSNLYSSKYEGLMYRVFSQSLDIMVTPNHRQVVTSRLHGGLFSDYRFESAIDIVNQPVAYLAAGNLSDRKIWNIPEFPIEILHNPNFTALIGFFIGDGHAARLEHRNINRITFHLKKTRKIEYLQNLTQALGLLLQSQASNIYTIAYSNIGRIFRQVFYTEDGSKQLPNDYLFLPTHHVDRLLEGLKNSDGSVKRNTWQYDTTSIKLADQLQALASVNNFVFNRRLTILDNPNHKNCHSLNYSTRLRPRVECSQKGRADNTLEEMTPYIGMIYCATVSTGAMIVRRNNKVIISGNSPFEHVATPLDSPYTSWGNFYGWRQYRYHLEQGQT